MNENSEFNFSNLDYEKMNDTLADPEFANWYYHHMIDNNYHDLSMEDFVNIIQKYEQNKYE